MHGAQRRGCFASLAMTGGTKFFPIMRVVAELPHPDFKITIHSMNHKYLVKIEQGSFEQTYKIAEVDLLDGVNSVFELLDEEFLKTVLARFHEMRKDFRASFGRYNY